MMMRLNSKRRLLPVLSVLLAGAMTPAVAGWETIWIDKFDGTGVNWDNWTAQTKANYNEEVQCYTDDDSSANRNYEVSNGTLKIIARRQAGNCDTISGSPHKSWRSGRINSKDKYEFLYGRIEARIKFHNLEAGTWPAFWALENRIDEQPVKGDGDSVGWPNPGAGEIDIWEWYANNPGRYITNFFNTGSCGSEVRHTYPNGAADVQQWHDYAMEWDANTITFFMDDTVVATHDITNCAQYKEPMFVLLNVAMGGNLGGGIDPGLQKATMEVDYVAHCKATSANDYTRCNEGAEEVEGLIITSTPATKVYVGNEYRYVFTTNSPNPGALVFEAVTLPGWLHFDSTLGLLTGTPTENEIGSHTVELSVSNGVSSLDETFVITVPDIRGRITDGGGSMDWFWLLGLAGLMLLARRP